VVTKATQALAFHTETEECLPAARGLVELRRDPQVCKALRKGGFFLIVPLVIETKDERCNLWLPTDLVEVAVSLANAVGPTRC
jgi:hypothetical protein